MNLVQTDIEHLKREQCENKLLHPNMNRGDLKALKELTDNQNITIKQVDKGGAVVKWNTVDYLEEANKQLSDREVYKSLDRDTRWEISHKIQAIIE